MRSPMPRCGHSRLSRLLDLPLGEEVIAVSEDLFPAQCRDSAFSFINQTAFMLERHCVRSRGRSDAESVVRD